MKNVKILLAVVLSTIMLCGCGKNSENKKTVEEAKDTTEIVENTAETTDTVAETSTETLETVEDTKEADDNGSEVQKKNEEDTTIKNNTNEDHNEEKNEINLNYIVYNNEKYGFQIKYPQELSVSADGLDDEGMAVTNEEGDFCIYAYGFNNEDGDTIDSMKESLMVEGAQVEDIDNGFIISYLEDDTVNKYVMKIGSGSINAMIITYPNEKDAEYKNMLNAIIGNFTSGDLSKAY